MLAIKDPLQVVHHAVRRSVKNEHVFQGTCVFLRTMQYKKSTWMHCALHLAADQAVPVLLAQCGSRPSPSS